ncbi:MAG: MaoC family dehydratase [Pseudonocardia sp.]
MAERVLDGAPRLGPLYVRAALGALGRRAGFRPDPAPPDPAPPAAAQLDAAPPDPARPDPALPDRTLVREGVTVDPAQLAAYARVCGFALGDALPPTFPAVLSFPLQVALMADRAFPLALPGLVHVRNTITAHRRIDAAEPLRIAVHAQRLAAHPKGTTVDLVTDVAGVWECRSTYLARGATGAQRRPSTAHPYAPQALGGPPTAVWHVDGGTGRRYARVSGDVNPIHLHPLTARPFGFRRAIAHGMWTAARALAALQGRLPDALTYDVEFGRPLLLPSTVELRTRRDGGGWDLDVRRAGSAAHHLRARVD